MYEKCVFGSLLQKNKFEIRFVGRHKGRKFAYYTDCDEKSKYLLYFCRTTHMFQMAIQPKLMEIRHLDAEGIVLENYILIK